MKKFFSFLVAALLGFAVQAQKSESIEGNGNIITRSVPIQPFTELDAKGVYQLILSQGSSESLKIEADENLQDLFDIKNEGQKLVIEMKKNKNLQLKGKSKLKVYLTFKDLNKLRLSTVGNVSSEGKLRFKDLTLDNNSVGNVTLDLSAENLIVKNTSVGNVHLEGKAESATINNSGVGSFRAGDFVVKSIRITNSGVGHAEVNAEKELQVEENMLGKVKNKGNAPMRKKGKVKV